jgi:hypothetical protein
VRSGSACVTHRRPCRTACLRNGRWLSCFGKRATSREAQILDKLKVLDDIVSDSGAAFKTPNFARLRAAPGARADWLACRQAGVVHRACMQLCAASVCLPWSRAVAVSCRPPRVHFGGNGGGHLGGLWRAHRRRAV